MSERFMTAGGQGIRGERITLPAYVAAAGPRRDNTPPCCSPRPRRGCADFATKRLNMRCVDVPALGVE
jgi:hypothetical protein